IRRKQAAVKTAAEVYRRARRALLTLGMEENDQTYRPLRPEDLRPFVLRMEEQQRGDSKKAPSWIWGDFSFVEKTKTIAHLISIAMRVHWFRRRAVTAR
ncbi:hypothetical protein B0H21DRAFT_660461, partial [Amylocystis lapponica]